MKVHIKYLLLLLFVLESLNSFFLLRSPSPSIFSQAFTLFSLLLVPGCLFLLTLKTKFANVWSYLFHSAGLSIILIYALGLILSFASSTTKIERPLDFLPFYYIHCAVMSILFLGALIRNWKTKISFADFNLFLYFGTVYIGSILISCVAILGAYYLNNGNTNVISLTWLITLSVLYLTFFVFFKRKFDFLKPYFILTMSLSMLWMLSARSWHLTGWDIVQELVTANSTFVTGKWSMDLIKDAYNACLSITILPTVLTNNTHITIEYLFKFLYPLIFAHFPVMLYFWFKRQTSKDYSLLAIIYIIAQPFFIQPMVALARQEISFFFFALLLTSIYSDDLKGKTKFALVTLYTAGLVTSHYSTTYITVVLFSLVYGAIVFLKFLKIIPVPQRVKSFQFYKNWLTDFKNSLKVWMVAFLILFAYGWYFLITQTAGNVQPAILEAFSKMSNLFMGEQKSQEVQQALPGASKANLTTDEDLSLYQSTDIGGVGNLKEERIEAIRSKYQLLPAYEYELNPAIPNRYAVLTKKILNYAKDGLKFSMLLGTFVMFFQTFKKEEKQVEFILFGLVSTALITVMILHPTIGLYYNISRIYLQLLVFLSVAAVVGARSVVWFVKDKYALFALALLFAVNFIYLQGGFTQILGGTPLLHLYNVGTDFEKFYVYGQEISAAAWLKENRGFQFTVYGDSFTGLRIRKEATFFPNTTIVPLAFDNNRSAYVFLSSTNKIVKKALITRSSRLLSFQYPLNYLDENRSLIYSNNHSAIYK